MNRALLPSIALLLITACTPSAIEPQADAATAVQLAAAPTVPAAVPYDRDLYRHWTDADGDCQDTRQEVLIAESLIPVTFDDRGCRVVAGQWYDAYTGEVFTDPSDLDIDHMVPLAEAHRSGGYQWSPELREAFANDLGDPDSLIAVSASANRSKSDRDPANWLPPDASAHCAYVAAWVAVKDRWGLGADPAELDAIDEVLAGCG